jgi:hypothetical protein
LHLYKPCKERLFVFVHLAWNGKQLARDRWGHYGAIQVMRGDLLQPPSGYKLDTWKEIATFFGRDERTVKRWEKERGLPVHRVPGGRRGTVYAFSEELTAWLRSSQQSELP